jgi:hypothetical protein
VEQARSSSRPRADRNKRICMVYWDLWWAVQLVLVPRLAQRRPKINPYWHKGCSWAAPPGLGCAGLFLGCLFLAALGCAGLFWFFLGCIWAALGFSGMLWAGLGCSWAGPGWSGRSQE